LTNVIIAKKKGKEQVPKGGENGGRGEFLLGQVKYPEWTLAKKRLFIVALGGVKEEEKPTTT